MANIRKRGNKFQVQVRRAGHRSHTKSFSRISEARAWARAQEVNIDRDEAGINKPVTVKLGDLLVRYQQEITPHKKSKDSETRRISRLLRDPISKTRLCDLSPDKLASFRDKRLKDGQRAASYDLQIIRHTINIAQMEWGVSLRENPVNQIRMPSPSKPRERRLTLDEYEKLLSFSEISRSYFLKPLIILGVETGMRLGEMLQMKWKDLDAQSSTLLLTDTKNGSSRVIPLSQCALDVIKNLPNGNENIIPVTYSAVKSAWQRLCNRCGIEDLRFHDLRHEAISRFFEYGLTLPEIANISGHYTKSQLLRYAHSDKNIVHQLAEQIDKAKKNTPRRFNPD